jgi:hypothetical protein
MNTSFVVVILIDTHGLDKSLKANHREHSERSTEFTESLHHKGTRYSGFLLCGYLKKRDVC